jgi:hypothetical protein
VAGRALVALLKRKDNEALGRVEARGVYRGMSLRGLRQKGVAHRPFVTLAARRTNGTHGLLPDAQKGADFGLDPAVDFASGAGANKDEVFHDRLRCSQVGYIV